MLVMRYNGTASIAEMARGCSCTCSPGGNADGYNFGGEGWCSSYCGCGGPSSTEDNREANLDIAYAKPTATLV